MHPEQVEYILAVDAADWSVGLIDVLDHERWHRSYPMVLRTIQNDGVQCSTQAYNQAASDSTGDLLVCNADDVFPPQDWDRLILESPLPRATSTAEAYWEPPPVDWLPRPGRTVADLSPWRDFLLAPGTGAPARDRCIVFQPIMSRGRYRYLGYFFFPEYRAMYADNDLTAHARQDGVVIPLRGVQLEHRHPVYGTAPMDAVYEHENRPENYEIGDKIFRRRLAEGFHPEPRIPGWHHPVNRFIQDRLIQEHDIRTVIEVGSFLGLSAVWFAQRVETVACIDKWQEDATEPTMNNLVSAIEGNSPFSGCTEPLPRDFKDLFISNMRKAGVMDKLVCIRGDSKQMAHCVPDADLVYIDADHSYEGCMADIANYRDKARKVICGDDFRNVQGWGVIEAVKKSFEHGNAHEPFWWVTV